MKALYTEKELNKIYEDVTHDLDELANFVNRENYQPKLKTSTIPGTIDADVARHLLYLQNSLLHDYHEITKKSENPTFILNYLQK